MRKNILLLLIFPFFLTSCFGPDRQFAGTMIGAHVGGALGSAIFGGGHSYSGAVFGDVVGTIAGAAIGSAVTALYQSYYDDDDDPGIYERPADSKYDATSSQRKPSYKLEPVRSEQSKAIADLKVKNLRFIDGNRDRIINANESCQLIFDICNDGKVAVDNITPYIYEVNESKHIKISNPSVIEHLEPGELMRYTIQIKTDSNLQPGKATFCIELADSEGLTVPCREFDLETAH